MKKQTKHSIKAHLLWSALILLSLLAVCAIPFALAQRNTAKRITAEQIAAANGQKTVPPSAGAVSGTLPASSRAALRQATGRSFFPMTFGACRTCRASRRRLSEPVGRVRRTCSDSASAENSAGSFI